MRAFQSIPATSTQGVEHRSFSFFLQSTKICPIKKKMLWLKSFPGR